MSVESVGVAFAAVSAGASAVSAYISRQAVDRAHRAFVWPSFSSEVDPAGRRILGVQLHNDGAGAAYDVRLSVATLTATNEGEVVVDADYAAQGASDVIRALRAGEASSPFKTPFASPEDDVWWLLVRWTDASRVRWELAEQGPSLLGREPRRLRTWRWQAWRPKRDW